LTDVTKAVSRYPKLHAQRKLINLEDQILLCRPRVSANVTTLGNASLEDASTLSLSAFLHDRARQAPIDMTPPAQEPEATQWRQHLAEGEKLYATRIGNMNLSCRQCHDDNVGATMRSFRVTLAYPVGFPVYRLSWQGMGSMDRRIRACFSGVQAETPSAQDLRLRQLELYLKHRARGQRLDGPSVKP
jgi:sulfur-oxidizing protein SoxA